MPHRQAGKLARSGDARGGLVLLRELLSKKPEDKAAHSYLLLLLHHEERDPRLVYREHRQWAKRHARVPASDFFPNPRDEFKRLNIGYLAPAFGAINPVTYFIKPILEAHDHERFAVTCYSDSRRAGSGTRGIQELADRWRDVSGETDQQVITRIRNDEIDILVDLAGHVAGNRLLVFAQKAAPVQVTWLGYPDTTGLTAIDYRLTDDIADPAGSSDRFNSETLVRLPRGFLCYQPRDESPEVAALPAWFSGHITFGSFQFPAKINAKVISCWAEIMKRTPRSHLLLHHSCSDYAGTQGSVRNRITEGFARCGIGPERISLVGALPASRHLELFARVDLMLDTFPYNGTTSTCEALWMGLPVVSREGDVHSARVGKSILTRIGLADLVACSDEEYVALSCRLAADLDWLANMRATLRRRMSRSPLLDARGFTLALETEYRKMWQRWVRATDESSRLSVRSSP